MAYPAYVAIGLASALALQACEGSDTPPPVEEGMVVLPFPRHARAITAPEDEPREEYWLDETLRLNQIQAKGSHNSYHLRPTNNDDPQWQYDVPPIPQQLDRFGVRTLELDLHYADGQVRVHHLGVVDDRTTCPLLTDCLAQIRSWSDANPGHQPLIVWLEFRDEQDAIKLIDHLDEIEQVLIDAWPRERAFTPDDLVGSGADVQSVIRTTGWPVLGKLRGKVIFVMLAFGDAPYKYAWEGNGLWGRRMFVSAADMNWRHAGFIAMDSPIEQEEEIKSAVRTGFMVRTRSDDLPDRGRDFWYKRTIALRSGAQMILTDYPDPSYIPGYDTNIPAGKPSRCNPLNAPAECAPLAVENPLLLGLRP